MASLADSIPARHFCDVGTGCGVIAYLLASERDRTGLAVDVQREMATFARENLQDLPVKVICADVRNGLPADCLFDLVVTNPPYGVMGAQRISPNPSRAIACTALNGDLLDFATAIHGHCAQDAHFCFVSPDSNWARTRDALEEMGWYAKRVWRFYRGDKPFRVAVDCVRCLEPYVERSFESQSVVLDALIEPMIERLGRSKRAMAD
ncbi:MAG: methyltransferase [Acidobacteria bacterium]|nr:methyltransferase [Acidobacteriota bacterium]